jgi:hypothetical protein
MNAARDHAIESFNARGVAIVGAGLLVGLVVIGAAIYWWTGALRFAQVQPARPTIMRPDVASPGPDVLPVEELVEIRRRLEDEQKRRISGVIDQAMKRLAERGWPDFGPIEPPTAPQTPTKEGAP